MRITEHPILTFKERRPVSFTWNGREMTGYEGEPVASALLAGGVGTFRRTERDDDPRGVFCGIGQCCECMVVIDGKPNIRSCVTPLREGMRVEEQQGYGTAGHPVGAEIIECPENPESPDNPEGPGNPETEDVR